MSCFTSQRIVAARSRTRVRPVTAGFTLVELLVVIGIIALLISILLPSLNSARESAKSVVCAGQNLRSVGQITHLFANDNEGTLPHGQAISIIPWGIGGAIYGGHFLDFIDTYGMSEEQMICPSIAASGITGQAGGGIGYLAYTGSDVNGVAYPPLPGPGGVQESLEVVRPLYEHSRTDLAAASGNHTFPLAGQFVDPSSYEFFFGRSRTAPDKQLAHEVIKLTDKTETGTERDSNPALMMDSLMKENRFGTTVFWYNHGKDWRVTSFDATISLPWPQNPDGSGLLKPAKGWEILTDEGNPTANLLSLDGSVQKTRPEGRVYYHQYGGATQFWY